MAQFGSDAFTGTAGTELTAYSASWTEHGSHTGGELVLTDANRVRSNAASGSLYYHSGTPASADYSASCDLYSPNANGELQGAGTVGRVDTAANTFYQGRYAGSTVDGWQVYKCVTGTFTQLGSTSTASLAAGSTTNIRLEMIGSAIKLYVAGSGTPTISATDSAITAAGKAGIRTSLLQADTNTSGLHIDNYSADDAAAAGGHPAIRRFGGVRFAATRAGVY